MAKRAPLVRDTGKTRQMAAGDTLRLAGPLNETYAQLNLTGSDTDIVNVAGNFVQLGTTTPNTKIQVLGFGDIGLERVVYTQTSTMTFAHSSSGIICPGGVDLTVAVGSVIFFRCLGGYTWLVEGGIRANGQGFVAVSDPTKLPLDGSAQMSGPVNEAQISYVDAGTTGTANLATATSNTIYLNGSGNVGSLGSAVPAGGKRLVNFQQVMTLVYDAAYLNLPGKANITTALGDSAEFVSLGAGYWLCTQYTRANGTPITAASDTNKLSRDGSLAMTGGFNLAPFGQLSTATATADLSTVAANSIILSSTSSDKIVQTFGSVPSGAERTVLAGTALVLQASSAMHTPGSVDLTLAAGDWVTLMSQGGGTWYINGGMRADGSALKSTAGTAGEPVITPGTTAQYWRGDKTWVDFATTVRGSVLSGMVVTSNNAVVETDTLLIAIGKLQTQLNNKLASTGNAASATKLVTARNINGQSFDGTADITVADATKIPLTQRGAANGVATLDASGLVPAAQLPSYVDDVLEFANQAAFPATGETGKIYIADDTNYQYRWTGSAYIQLVASPGTTDAVPEGSTNKYFTAARVLATVLAGIDVGTSAVISASDTVLSGLGKLQAQITAAASAFAANVRATVLTGFVTTSSAAVVAADTVLVALGKLQAQTSLAYTRANALGTVSQSGGVPTGAVIETGTNANGTYTKYLDGTMICTKTVSVTAAINSAFSNGGYYNPTPLPTQTMPATFVAVPKTFVQMTSSSATTGWIGGITDSTTSVWGNCYQLELFSRASQGYTISYEAIGRWF